MSSVKKMIEVKIYQVHIDDCSLDSVLSELTNAKETYGGQFEKLFFTLNSCGCGYECGCSTRIWLEGERLENDEEFTKRIELEKARTRLQEYKERKLLQELQNKYVTKK